MKNVIALLVTAMFPNAQNDYAANKPTTSIGHSLSYPKEWLICSVKKMTPFCRTCNIEKGGCSWKLALLSWIYFFESVCIYYLPHDWAIPQVMTHLLVAAKIANLSEFTKFNLAFANFYSSSNGYFTENALYTIYMQRKPVSSKQFYPCKRIWVVRFFHLHVFFFSFDP